jgi:hypothetical protein
MVRWLTERLARTRVNEDHAADEREAADRLRPRTGDVTPLGPDRPPTAYKMDSDGLGYFPGDAPGMG